jgi:hypothetical protein
VADVVFLSTATTAVLLVAVVMALTRLRDWRTVTPSLSSGESDRGEDRAWLGTYLLGAAALAGVAALAAGGGIAGSPVVIGVLLVVGGYVIAGVYVTALSHGHRTARATAEGLFAAGGVLLLAAVVKIALSP